MPRTTTRQIQVKSRKAAELTFGIEIECFLPRGSVRVGRYHRGATLGGDFPAGWNAQSDSSLHTTLRNYQAVEIVSPILQGADGLAQVRKLADLLRRMRARVNASCGFHCHIGCTSAAGHNYDDVADWIRRLLNLTAQHELAFYGASGTRRRYNHRWCGSLANGAWKNKKEALKKKLTAEQFRREAAGIGRYQLLNVAPAFGRGTVEFRCFSGTTDALKMEAYLTMCLAAATRALDRNTSFDAPQARYAGSGAAGAMKRWFYLMGWTKGRKDYYLPECVVEGWIGELDDLGPIKRELARLARKFDGDGDA